ncbi:MAG TPA: NUDIX domain-containing protein [Candidatus Binatia bacterium]|jgi:8-oxo-dGTP pyrophosphatase MutT (NUDIX family)
MAISEYLKNLRAHIGTTLVLVPSVSALLYDDEDRMLLVRDANSGVWSTPGGAIEPDETPQDAIVREVWEETSLVVEPTRLRGVFHGPDFRVVYANGDQVSYVITVFECRRLAGEPKPDCDEVLETRWVAASELADLGLSRWARGVLPRLIDPAAPISVPRATWRPPRS